MNNNRSVRRRYFIVEGAEGEAVKETALAAQKAHRARRKAVEEKYGADGLMLSGRESRPIALLIEAGNPAPDGAKAAGRHVKDDKTYIEYQPLKNRKAGKRLAADLAAVGGFDGSEMILKTFDAVVWIAGGNAMHVSTAGIVKETVVVQVPESDDELFTPPACFREIKKSEYVALTEE